MYIICEVTKIKDTDETLCVEVKQIINTDDKNLANNYLDIYTEGSCWWKTYELFTENEFHKLGHINTCV